MLSTYIRTAQVVELAIYALIAYALGWRWPQALLAMVAAFLALRVALIALEFAIAWLRGSPRAPEHRIGAFATAAMVVRESLWLIGFNVLFVPWERLFLRADPVPRPTEGTPIVLVHGYFANRGYFHPLVRHLEAAGLGPVFVPNLRSWHATVERFEEELGECLERIHAGCGKRAVVIAHSMGGLGLRAHLARHGSGHVARIITIASPHHGTELAYFGIGANARQMQPGSAFLAWLEGRERDSPPAIPALSLYSTHDNMIAPQESSRLPWARNVAFKGRGHLEMAYAPEVVEALLAELRAP